jgi:hypothetical protein
MFFISQSLITQWTVSPSQVEANPAVYTGNTNNFNEMGSFGYNNVAELKSAIEGAANYFSPNDPPGIAVSVHFHIINAMQFGIYHQ